MRMKITTAGRAKLVNATNTGTNTVLISHIGLTATGFTPTAAMTQLPGEFKRMTTFGGKSVAAGTIHVTLQDSGAEKYTLRGFGLYLSDGTLFAVYGQADAIMEKASISTLLLAADVVFADIDTAQIKFGSTEFLNPPATETVPGVVELADSPETILGADAVRAVTARGLKATLDNRFGANAPTSFVKTLLSIATAAAVRVALELKGAALKDMGHGNGLNADMLDGMHAADFPQIGKVQPIDTIAGNSNQVRWIKLGTLPWRGPAASILLLEMTNGAIGSPRYAWEQIAASARTFSETTTVLTQAIVDGMVQHTRIGADASLDRPCRFGLVLTTDAAGLSTGVELWLQQREYNQGHAVRVVNATGATYHGPGTYSTTEPQGIIYATVQPLAYMGDLRRLVDATENRWGRRQTFALGLYLPSDQTIDLGFGGGSLRGTDTGSVVLAAGTGPTGDSGGYVYLRPNGSSNASGQLALYKNGRAEMVSARVGLGNGSADGSVLLELFSQRPWHFRQLAKDGDTVLELFDTTGGKQFRLTNTSNSRVISFNPTSGLVEAPEFRGMLNGNAVSASKLATPRTINGTAFDGSANIVTTSWGAYRKVTIGSTAKTLNGGADFSWSLAEIGAASLTHQHSIGDVQGLTQALDAKANWLGAIQYKTYDEHLQKTAFTAVYHSATEAPSDAPLKSQHNVLHFGSMWGRAQIAIPNDFDRVFFRTGTRTDWLELWHTGNFTPATKANLSGADFTGAVTAPSFKARSNGFIGGAKYAVLAPDAKDGEVLLRPNGGDSVVGQLSVTLAGVRWDGKGMWHSGNFEPSTKANRFPGQVIMFAGKVAPSGTLLCNGAAVSRATYAELFAAIGTLYGAGDGKTTFNLPAMGDGTVVTHTNSADAVGGFTAGEVIRHAHTASSASAGTHSHAITVAGGGAHSHGASAAAAGEHAHGAWTDQQGHHGHTGGTSAAGEHQHISPFGDQMAYPWGQYGNLDQTGTRASGVDHDNSWPLTNPAGNHAHAFTTDGAGAHGHNIGMNNAGNHTHTISVAQVGDHGHSASAADGGAHTHAVTVNNTGGDRNLPAGLRMIYCITY
ncbi:TPA: phage tail protein [Stenotrophomonas maltophilia]|uniref:phage tail protein n=1 Tax=Stenotrophomonas maltophilia TaxID=40324 RepID=UPI00215526F3|nr:phage tail protein [Stenotrophomonas maltophilia]